MHIADERESRWCPEPPLLTCGTGILPVHFREHWRVDSATVMLIQVERTTNCFHESLRKPLAVGFTTAPRERVCVVGLRSPKSCPRVGSEI